MEDAYNSPMSFPTNEPRWVTERALMLLHPPLAVRNQLTDSGSLTKRIIRGCSGQFRVEVLSQGFTAINRSERQRLHLQCGETANTRSVLLYCGDHPWVFAHTVIPHYALRRSLRRLTQLGNRSLGAVLHASRVMERSGVEYARFLPHHRMFQEATTMLKRAPHSLWGRRILYRIDGDPLLVNELFLVDLPD